MRPMRIFVIIFLTMCFIDISYEETWVWYKRINDSFSGTVLRTLMPVKRYQDCVHECEVTVNCNTIRFVRRKKRCLLYSHVERAQGVDESRKVWVDSFQRIYEGCDDGWIRYGTTCYWVDDSNKLTWNQANNTCAAKDAFLVTVTSQEEYMAVSSLQKATTGNVWLGGYCQKLTTKVIGGDACRWRWVTGEYWGVPKMPTGKFHYDTKRDMDIRLYLVNGVTDASETFGATDTSMKYSYMCEKWG